MELLEYSGGLKEPPIQEQLPLKDTLRMKKSGH